MDDSPNEPDVWSFAENDLVQSIAPSDIYRTDRSWGLVLTALPQVARVLWSNGEFGTYWSYELRPHFPQNHNYVGVSDSALIDLAKKYRLINCMEIVKEWESSYNGMGNGIHSGLEGWQDDLLSGTEW